MSGAEEEGAIEAVGDDVLAQKRLLLAAVVG